MALTQCTINTQIIGGLGTRPDERALSTQQFKDKFDEFGTLFKTYFNTTHIPEVEAMAANTNRLRKLMGVIY